MGLPGQQRTIVLRQESFNVRFEWSVIRPMRPNSILPAHSSATGLRSVPILPISTSTVIPAKSITRGSRR